MVLRIKVFFPLFHVTNTIVFHTISFICTIKVIVIVLKYCEFVSNITISTEYKLNEKKKKKKCIGIEKMYNWYFYIRLHRILYICYLMNISFN